MTRTGLSRVVRTAGVAILPAVVVICCAGRADAECGDYVRVIDQSGTTQPGHESKPCQGPFCHGGPKAPNPAPLAPPSPVPDPKGLATDTFAPVGREFVTCHPPADEGRPVRRPDPIFHPPRAV